MMRALPAVVACFLVACQAPEITAESLETSTSAQGYKPIGAFDPSVPLYIPSVVVPIGQTEDGTHFGPTMHQWWDVWLVSMMVGRDIVASQTDYWRLQFGAQIGGAFSLLLEVDTRPVADGGIGDLVGGVQYDLQPLADAVGWGSTLTVYVEPHGKPDPLPCVTFEIGNVSFGP